MQAYLKQKGCKAVIGAHRKEAAVRAGLGSIGKHNLVMNKKYGSWVAYQSIITNAEIEPDTPATDDMCGSCEICLKACPSAALYAPRRLDPRKCVAYMLTSHDIKDENLPHINNYILGCDACQEACPKNRNIKPKQDVESLLPESIGMYPPLRDLIYMTDGDFQKEIIDTIGAKMSGGGIMNTLMKNRIMRTVLKKLIKTLLKGKEVLPETFVHASGNLQVYKRNALIAAGNMGDKSMLKDVQAFNNDPYLGKYAAWAERKIKND
jgi:epoxyqueuosine reductase QueG